MKVLLIRPAAEKKSMARCLPLGLLAIGSVLKREGHRVHILDLRIADFPEQDLERTLGEFDPDVVGIGVMTIESHYGFIDAIASTSRNTSSITRKSITWSSVKAM
jgi:hypothetical protein